jgi:exodeoxyribonuclease VIII
MIYEDMPFAEYDRIDAVSRSDLKAFAESPADYAWRRQKGVEVSKPMRLGSAVDALAFGGEEGLEAAFGVAPTKSRRAKAYKEWAATREQPDDLTPDELELVRGMHDALLTVDRTRGYIEHGRHQLSVVWDGPHGLRFKGRPDTVLADGIVDLKTSNTLQYHMLQRKVLDGWYHVQAAMYQDGWEAETGERLPFFWAFVRSTPPHCVEVFACSQDWINLGRGLYLQTADRFAGQRLIDEWPLSSGRVETLEPPRWAYY